MSREFQLISVRVPGDFVDGADDLRPVLAARGQFAHLGEMTRSDVIRIALARGLRDLRREYGGDDE